MPTELLLPALVGLLPVACFLAVLLYLDSYKLLKLRVVVAVVACGAIVAGASYLVNGWALGVADIDFVPFSRYVSPFIEETLKGLVIAWLIGAHRVGFLVDAAIFGFAVGTGFALVENIHLLGHRARRRHRDVDRPRLRHGDHARRRHRHFRRDGRRPAGSAGGGADLRVRTLLPGLAVAVALHSAYNHLLASPRLATLAVLVAVPLLLYVVFRRSEKAVGDWLGRGFDADTETLELINSGHLSDSPVGRYLRTLKHKFQGPVVADLICYLRLYTELALRAKGVLMMRENGFEVPIDDETRSKLTEMRYLEKSIGRTGLLALKPMMHMSNKDLWQLHLLES